MADTCRINEYVHNIGDRTECSRMSKRIGALIDGSNFAHSSSKVRDEEEKSGIRRTIYCFVNGLYTWRYKNNKAIRSEKSAR